jgi:hypothetical protein
VPTNISLTSDTLAENEAINTVVGNLSTTDPDISNTFIYSLVSGTGATDNASFNISGSSLRSSVVFDFEMKSSYSVRIRTTDQGSLYFEKTFTITITNVVETPIITEGDVIDKNATTNPFTFTLNATYGDSDTLTWSIKTQAGHGIASVSGTGVTKVINYTHSHNYVGPDSFVVQVSDANGGMDTITVDLTIYSTVFIPIALK